MSFLENLLGKLAKAQKSYGIHILIFFVLFTGVMIYGATKIRFTGDISKEMPQELPIYQLNDKIQGKFSGQDIVFILVELDYGLKSQDTPHDIRDPQIMEYVKDLHDSLEKEPSVSQVVSVGPAINGLGDDPFGVEEVSSALKRSGLDSLINDKYSMTILMVYAELGTSQAKIRKFTSLIEDKIDALGKPRGTNIEITGTPNVIVKILELLQQDAAYTLIIASVIILSLLILMQKSLTRGLLIFIPTMLGIAWTMGTMGWFGISISIATAGLGAMILGLGVEYGVFILTRYHEARDFGKSREQSLSIAVPAVGSAILGSGTTTIVGFLALTLSIMPMLQKLGLSLAMGIFYSIIASVVVEPVLILLEERYECWFTASRHDHYKKKREKGCKNY